MADGDGWGNDSFHVIPTCIRLFERVQGIWEKPWLYRPLPRMYTGLYPGRESSEEHGFDGLGVYKATWGLVSVLITVSSNQDDNI